MLRSRSYEARYFQSCCRHCHTGELSPLYAPRNLFTASLALLQYIPASGPFIPIAKLVPSFPALSYQLFFEDHTAAAIAELEKNVTRTMRATLRTVDSPPPAAFLKSPDSFLSGWDDVDIVRDMSHIITYFCTMVFADTSCPFLHCSGRGLYGRTVRHPGL